MSISRANDFWKFYINYEKLRWLVHMCLIRRSVVYENRANRCHNAPCGFRVYGISFKRHIRSLFSRSFANGSRTFSVATTEWLFTADVSSFLRGKLFQRPEVFLHFRPEGTSVSSRASFLEWKSIETRTVAPLMPTGYSTRHCHTTVFMASITLTHVERDVIVAVLRSTLFLRAKVWLTVDLIVKDSKGMIVIRNIVNKKNEKC